VDGESSLVKKAKALVRCEPEANSCAYRMMPPSAPPTPKERDEENDHATEEEDGVCARHGVSGVCPHSRRSKSAHTNTNEPEQEQGENLILQRGRSAGQEEGTKEGNAKHTHLTRCSVAVCELS
jgi:hypothetical protein